jgi:uncharacterized membrane protein YobD (UPF0266 family)
MDQPLIKIIKNPPQAPKSSFRLTRQIKIRGEAIYIIFAGIVLSVFCFFILMDSSLIASLLFSWLPLAFSFIFYLKFVKDKPKYYLDYYLNELFGNYLTISNKKPKKIYNLKIKLFPKQ